MTDGVRGSAEFALLCCPFCGSEDLEGPHRTDYIGDHYEPHYWVDCNECPAGMNVEGETPENLTKAWNRRPDDSVCNHELR